MCFPYSDIARDYLAGTPEIVLVPPISLTMPSYVIISEFPSAQPKVTKKKAPPFTRTPVAI